MTWFDESLHDRWSGHGYAQRFKISSEVVRKSSGQQELVIFDTAHFGRVLALDGIVQTTERDEFAYHEMLVHVPAFAHGSPSRVLIIGGGDGGALREVLRHQGVSLARQVEIDSEVVDLCREYMPSLSDGAFEDPRTDLVIADGCKFVAEGTETYDVIIVDSTDPIGVGEVLFTREFYADCRARLSPGGILVAQSGVPSLQAGEATETWRRLSDTFADATVYLTVVPTYIGGFMALGWGCDDPAAKNVPESELSKRFTAANIATRYYSPAVHRAAFALPPFIEELLN